MKDDLMTPTGRVNILHVLIVPKVEVQGIGLDKSLGLALQNTIAKDGLFEGMNAQDMAAHNLEGLQAALKLFGINPDEALKPYGVIP